MKKRILCAGLIAACAIPAQAHHAKRWHHHTSVSYPDSVMLDGKEYKVCKAGMQDDCIQPAQAGLNRGRMKAGMAKK